MVLMAIDHVRYFLSSARFDPTDPAQTTLALFVTRWVTHFCAPVFTLLAGVGAYLSLGRGGTRRDSPASCSPVGSGCWSWSSPWPASPGSSTSTTASAAPWFSGRSAGPWWRSRHWYGCRCRGWPAFGLRLVAAPQLFDRRRRAPGSTGWLWTILHQPEFHRAPCGQLFVLYPLIPWIGVMALGYAFGDARRAAEQRRDRIYVRLGLTLTAGFVIVRLTNAYGDPSPWTAQSTGGRTVLSFLNTTKYPASLLFLLMTLGSGHRAAAVPGARPRPDGGPAPHPWPRATVLLAPACAVDPPDRARVLLWRYGEVIPWLYRNPPTPLPEGYGYGLAVVYAVTLAVVAVLYPVCRWFAEVKHRRREAWLSYL